MAKRKAKRKHSVYASLEVPELSKAGTSLELEIYAESQKIGHLKELKGIRGTLSLSKN
jgi:hypothetical protein